MLYILIVLGILFYIIEAVKFLHISDIHLDLDYTPMTANNCYLLDSRLGCCHKYNIPKEPYDNCSQWGNNRCDLPLLFVNNTLRWIKENIVDLDFIIYTGDSANHNDIRQNIHFNINTINKVYDIFTLWFSDIKVFNTIGNHDTFPVDQSSNIINRYFFTNYAKQWIGNNWLTNDTYDDIMEGGYYIEYIPSIRIYILNINSLLYDKNNIFNVTQLGVHQMKWVNTKLQLIKNNHSRVIIITHLDPYTSESNQYYREELLTIMNNFKDIIIVTLYGHTHKDEIILFKNNENVPISFGFIPGSITLKSHESSFRIYEYDIENFSIVDYTQYISNLSKIIEHNDIIFTKSYNLKQEYNITQIDIKEFEILYNNILNNEDICNRYCTHYFSLKEYKRFKCSINSINKIKCN